VIVINKISFKEKLVIFLFASLILTPSHAAFSQQAPAPAVKSDAVVDSVAVAPGNDAVSAVADNAKVSLDFKDAEIGTVLRVISLKSGVNIVAGPEVVGMVTIRLEEVEWEKALDVILRTYNYVYEKDGNVIRITTREKMQLEPVDTKTFILNYAKAADTMASVQDILTERGRVKVSERMNMLIVTDIPTNIFRIGQVIDRLDKRTPQAYIDSKIISTDAQVAENLGILWGVGADLGGASRPTTFPFTTSGDGENLPAPIAGFFPRPAAVASVNPSNPRDFPLGLVTSPGSGTYTYGTLSFSALTAAMRMLKTDTSTKVISNPRVVVLNNQEAVVQVGQDYPVPTFERNTSTGVMEVTGFDYKKLGVIMKVTPHINSSNEILVDLSPEVSSAATQISFGTVNATPFNVTTAKTQVMMKSGETIAIGGLLTDNVDTSETKVPYLSDIPLIGKALFKAKRQTAGSTNSKKETLFFVTVTSVDSYGQPISDSVRKDDLSSQDNASTPDKNNASTNASSAAGAQKTAA